jgi:hypothetical protein
MLKRSELAGAETISMLPRGAERIPPEAISSPHVPISCPDISSAPLGASCEDMGAGPRHKPHDKSRVSVQAWSEVEACFGIDMNLEIFDDDGDGGEVLGEALDDDGADGLDDDADAGEALDDKHQKGEEAPQDDQGGQAAGRAGSWGGVSGKGRLEIPERVRDVVGALDTVFKACPYHTFLYLFC